MPKIIPPETWQQAQHAYVTGNESYAAVAQRFGVSKSSLESKASAGNWKALREAYRLTQGNLQENAAPAQVQQPSNTSEAPCNGQVKNSAHLTPEMAPPVLSNDSPQHSPALESHSKSVKKIDLNQLLEDAISQASDGLKELEPRSFERTATVLLALIKTYSELNPPTVGALVEKVLALGYSPVSFVEELKKQWSINKSQ